MKLGIGIGWRPEIAEAVEALPGIDWVEAVAENICVDHLPDSLVRLRERGVTVVPHGVSLGLGGADRPDPGRLADLAARATLLEAPLVTEHIAFVRAGGPRTASRRLEAGHLLPVPRTREALDVLCENVRIAQDALPVPLALENIAALISWPDEELTEGRFLAELVERTGVRLLIDVANLHTNHVNRGENPAAALDELPLESIAYVHVAGGVERDGVWHDTHAHPVTRPVLDVLTELRARVTPPGVLLERDDDFPPASELAAELDLIRDTLDTAAHHPARPTLRARPARDVRVAREVPEVPEAEAPQQHPHPQQPPPEPTTGVTTAITTATTTTAATTRLRVPPTPERTTTARGHLAVAQTALLSALVAGTPAPEGFDPRRLAVQSRALAAKRAGIVAKVAPELPDILGEDYRRAFIAYARRNPLTTGHRRDALDFAETLLSVGRPADPAARRRLTQWWRDRSGSRPPNRAVRLVRAARGVLVGR
ncbi:DUF692 domain-containing protein [Streptomyces sp. AM 4-1-1]|uniref:DUF692 domain-containing protein n=1 Tax=Streptomyces sp. AM 4-1-1 TaxID=3028710 RepID=UPI0023B9D8DF|nr:DUF692 domain-containing protein [Streptomyces sp. AM 4-1-1]WEH36458.1 DUF692 domain-containing protein [Streptomyces sp. AM 4-1-1]